VHCYPNWCYTTAAAEAGKEEGMRLRLLVLILGCTLAVVAEGCGVSRCPGDDDVPEETTDSFSPEPAALAATGAGVILSSPELSSTVSLLPAVMFQGEQDWRGGGSDGECVLLEGEVACPAGDAGTVKATVAEDTVVVHFVADADAAISALALAGTGTVQGAHSWLSNGFQSWSQSGVLAIGPVPSPLALDEALHKRGEHENHREGTELSWWYSVAGGGDAAFLAGALTADRFKAWVQVHRNPPSGLYVRLGSGGAGEAVKVAAGQTVEGTVWMVRLGDDPNVLLEEYGEALPSRAHVVAAPAEAGWNSWYELWDTVDEQAVRENATLASAWLAPYFPDGLPGLRIVVDDGWQKGWGDWEPNLEKFPSGLDGLALDLSAQGFEMGVWLAPFLVHEDSALVSDHPDWFVQGADYVHPAEGGFRILDVTHPDAAQHLTDVITTIVGWGYGLLKIDFLFAGTFEGQRNQEVTGLEAYRRGLKIIREAAGEETLLLAVGAPGVPSFPYVDAWRVGADIAYDLGGVGWPYIVNQARSISVRWAECLATLCDPDPLLLRDLPLEQVEAAGWVVAFAGGALFLSDDLRGLPEERKGWGMDPYRAAHALGRVPARPEAPFEVAAPSSLGSVVADAISGTISQVVPPVWVMPDGKRVALNVGDDEIMVEGIAVAPHEVRVLGR